LAQRRSPEGVHAPDVRDRFISQGIELPLGTPEQFATFMAADSKRWGEVVRRGNIKVE